MNECIFFFARLNFHYIWANGKKGNVHGRFIEKSEKNAGERKIMIMKKSIRNRVRQPTKATKKQAKKEEKKW